MSHTLIYLWYLFLIDFFIDGDLFLDTYVPSNSLRWYLSSILICLSISFASFRGFLPESFLPKRGILSTLNSEILITFKKQLLFYNFSFLFLFSPSQKFLKLFLQSIFFHDKTQSKKNKIENKKKLGKICQKNNVKKGKLNFSRLFNVSLDSNSKILKSIQSFDGFSQ